MNVFLSWSGHRSRAVAELLKKWLKCVLQASTPWISSEDIDRGSLWFSELQDQLKDTSTGIICLTADNLTKPWLLFEAGALAKGLSSSRVCTFLIDIDPSLVQNPLAQFNHTMPTKEGMWQLVASLNKRLEDRQLESEVLKSVFNTYWTQFEKDYLMILEEHPIGEKMPRPDDSSLLQEVLQTVRTLDRRLRGVESQASRKGIRPEDPRHKFSVQVRRDLNFLRGKAQTLVEPRVLGEEEIKQLFQETFEDDSCDNTSSIDDS
ncbi:toll/interleukin-1 receptor domain-containing protein [Oculatella sp. LEGE 06141]|uniref:TIR domain-containing protein n=1 Tax=Oculatella sp. LEGE 06141 TaxID=1828648 RepID=UPI001880AB94|nr:TIR domain-containing protein [Oculatella sp. LEGE 06141]MBE9182418.1 toll/interleukin-1 receptor domain-containing protein [Oculatella sp. LEGE 06141]